MQHTLRWHTATSTSWSTGRNLLVTLLGTALLALALVAPAGPGSTAFADTAPPDASVPTTMSSDALPTVQIDGVVWAQVVIGNTVYVGGDFQTARPAGAAVGTQTVTRKNLLAYDLNTGNLVTSFAPNPNAVVRALAASPDGSKLYVGGQFTTMQYDDATADVTRNRIAAFNTATGALITGFAASTNSTVNGIYATATQVYLAGIFSTTRGVARNGISAVTATAGDLLAWAPVKSTDGTVKQIVVSPDGSKVILGGSFTTMNGSGNPGYGLVAVDSNTGTTNLLPFAVNGLVRDAQSNSSIMSLTATADGFYGSGYVFNRTQGNLEGVFKSDWNGNLVWVEDCHGDSYSVFPSGSEVYVTGHSHYCGNIGGFPQTDPTANWTFQRATAFSKDAQPGKLITKDPYGYYNWEGKPQPRLLTWFPDINTGTFTGQGQGAWNIGGNANYVVYGGEFTQVNGKSQQGLVRFARAGVAGNPNADGPRLSGANYTPTLTSFAQGVQVNWPANYDRDNEALTYQLLRNNVPIGPSVTKRSTFWNRPNLSYLDTTAVAGTSYSYRLRVSDTSANANTVTGDGISFTPSGGTSYSPYDQAILRDSPESYWPLNDTSATTSVTDLATGNTGTRNTVTTGADPAITGDGTAMRFAGNSASYVASGTARLGLNTVSEEAWFKTTTTTGGKILGYGNVASGNSTSSDRQIYMAPGGRIFFGASRAAIKTVNSVASYNNGQWHHVVATNSPSGMTLYVDGVLVGSRSDTVSTQFTSPFWRIGGDQMSGWPSNPTTTYFNGDIDQVAVYPEVLTQAKVQAHYALRTGGGATNVAPVAAFTSSTNNLVASLDGSASTDSDGTVASYAWDFGDTTTGTGATPSHTYASAGTYAVKLTVTDNDGATGTVTKNVVVSAAPPANVAPKAAFTSSTTNLVAALDGSGSTDSDGTVASYAWDFGDTSTGTGAAPSHTYAAAGTYAVKLTVTDDDGGTDTLTKDVTVSAAPVGTPFVSDDFNRTVASGLGNADTGGAWVMSGGNADFAVNGTAGVFKLSAAGVTRSAYLGATLRDSSDTTLSFSSDKAADSAPTYLSVIGRRVSSTADYRTEIKINTNGTLAVSIGALQGLTTAVNIGGGTKTLPGPVTAGTVVKVRMQTFGTSPTTVQAKVWLASASEPTDWTVTTTDTYAALQAPGGIGFRANLSGSATNAPRWISLLSISAKPVE